MFLVFTTACQNEETTPQAEPETPIEPTIDNNRKDIAITKSEEQMAAQNTDFAFNLFRTMEQAYPEKGENALSPISASFALSMLANGTQGETLDELLKGLGWEEFTSAQMNAFNKKLLSELPTLDRTSSVALANSIWFNNGFKALEGFTKNLTENYNAEVRQTDFNTAVPVINRWCSDHTNGCIKEFLESLDPTSQAVLLNATYFKGNWKIPFLKENTRKETFYNEDGTSCEADFMWSANYFHYGKNEQFAAIELPYGNEAFSLQVILPNKGQEWKQCIEALTGETWNTFQKGMKRESVSVQLPKFTIEQKDNLKEALNLLGIKRVFTREADFGKMTGQQLYLGVIKQATFFRIDEKGTEAAAITGTATDVENNGGEAIKPIDFHAQRPFLFILTEKSTGTILFIGKVTNMN